MRLNWHRWPAVSYSIALQQDWAKNFPIRQAHADSRHPIRLWLVQDSSRQHPPVRSIR